MKSGEARSLHRAWRLRDQRLGLGTVIAATALIGFGTWFAIETHRGSASARGASATATKARGPVAASPGELRSLAASLGHPVYWVGPRRDTTYELTESGSGQILIRYLPKGVPVGAKHPYLTVGTYPVANAFAVTREALASGVKIGMRKAIAGYAKDRPTNVYLAFPDLDLQIEVFDPSPSVPPRLVAGGKVVPV